VVIIFRNTKLGKLCNSLLNAQRKWGDECGKKLLQRLVEIADSDNLLMFTKVHQRCHQLKGEQSDQWSADLKHPLRLIFKIADEPIPKLKDGGVDLAKVSSVKIWSVEDTHG
jgi:plasmid maintenance system killer protein